MTDVADTIGWSTCGITQNAFDAFCGPWELVYYALHCAHLCLLADGMNAQHTLLLAKFNFAAVIAAVLHASCPD